MNLDRRIAITGMGVCCPLGRNVNEFWENLIAGKSSVRNITKDYPKLEKYKVKIGSLFRDFEMNPDIPIEQKERKNIEGYTQFGIEAAYQAVNDSGILDYHPDEIRERTGVIIGVGFGGIRGIEREHKKFLEKGIDRISPYFVSKVIPDAPSGYIAMLYEFHATESPASVAACDSGASAIAAAARYILLGDADIMITGGVEQPGASLSCGCFGNARALSTRNENPEEASRPFDRDRDGFVMGEGAGILVLEELEHAKKRGARIYGELLGYGLSQDAWHLTQPRPDCKYTVKAMVDALKRAKLNPEQIDYINAHGTSTRLNDALETKAIKIVFGEHAYRIEVNATKSMIGHTFGAAGGLEFIVTLKTIQDGLIHLTRNLDNPDKINIKRDPNFIPCDLNYCRETKKREVNCAISTNFGFYGHNTALLAGKFTG